MDMLQFIERAKKVHGDKYDYSKVNYVNNKTKVCIICPRHGEFWQTPHNHLIYGCNECANEVRRNNSRSSVDEFIAKAIDKHGNKYDYSKVIYKNANTKVCIICHEKDENGNEHGEFWQTPSQHLHYGCIKCANEKKNSDKRWTNEIFSKKITEAHGNKYDTSETNYVNSRTPIEFVCKTHGKVKMLPLQFLRYGCLECHRDEIKKNATLKKDSKLKEIELEKERKIKQKHESYIKKFIEKHNDKYDYSKVGTIKNGNTKIRIICPKHGEFLQLVKNHANGCNCPKCASEELKRKFTLGYDEFVKKANLIHGNKYDYSKVEYTNYMTKVCIICPKHGEFWQTPSMHISEHQGCPECGTLSSYGENEIFNFIHDELKINDVTKRNKTVIPPKEIDIYIESYKFGIEYDGLRWHSEKFGKDKNYHLAKTLSCKDKGISLIHIFEDEWNEKSEIVKHKLSHLLGKDKDLPKIYARKCTIEKIDKTTCDEFLEKYHIQGKTVSSVRFGAFFNNELIGVMTFVKSNNKEFILNRFATDFNYKISGVAGKILSEFIRKHNPNKIVTFADRRWTTNEHDNLYTKIGFELNSTIAPNYSYVTENDSQRRRFHKFNFRKKALNKKYGFDMSMTEKEMAEKLKAYKIWDCGLFKYVWTKE